MYRSFIQKNESEVCDSTKVIALFDKALNVAHPSAEVAELRAAYMSLKKMPADSVCRAISQTSKDVERTNIEKFNVPSEYPVGIDLPEALFLALMTKQVLLKS